MAKYLVTRISNKRDLVPGINVEIGNGGDRFDAFYCGAVKSGEGKKKNIKHVFYAKVKRDCLEYTIPDADLVVKRGRVLDKTRRYVSTACDEVGRLYLERAGFIG